MFETKEGLKKGMREATKNLEESRGLAAVAKLRRRDGPPINDYHI